MLEKRLIKLREFSLVKAIEVAIAELRDLIPKVVADDFALLPDLSAIPSLVSLREHRLERTIEFSEQQATYQCCTFGSNDLGDLPISAAF